MKKTTIFLSYSIMSCIFVLLLTRSVFADNTTDFFVEEHQKSILRDSAADDQNQTQDDTPYQDEKNLIIRQLETITGDEETRYIIVPGDTLTIHYNDRHERPGANYIVNSRGEIQMPLVGPVKVTGYNRKEARQKINELLSQYIRQPKAELRINVSGQYLVIGAVLSPGVYKIEQNLSALEAIYRAKGPINSKAQMASVLLIRGGKDDPVITRLNLKNVIKKGDHADNILIKPGDIVYVPTTFIFHLDNFQKTVYRHILTYYGLGGTEPLKNP